VTRVPLVLYVINVDWFFVSHFLGFAAEARRRGYRCGLACEVTDKRDLLEAAGIAVFPLELTRGARNAGRYWRAARSLSRLIEAQRPDVVHAIGLEAVTAAALARRLRAGAARFVFAPTGLGTAGLRPGVKGLLLRRVLPAGLRLIAGGGAGWLFENDDDPKSFGLRPARHPDVLVVGGAGADIEAFRPMPFPPRPPLRVAMVARMIWAKGPDLAVSAVTALRRSGLPVELTLVGDPDPFNPNPIAPATLQEWNRTDGMRWVGRCSDIPAVWAEHHVACLPSRGGEGLPKSLIEAAASGRPMVTADVPGCRTFVRDGIDGFVVEPGNAAALAGALRRFVEMPDLVESMGRAARERAVAGYSDRGIAAQVVDYYGVARRR
jgi:glycosyltransferase involved in cell wall biosynthesis